MKKLTDMTKKWTSALVVALLGCGASLSLFAQDIEIYTSAIATGDTEDDLSVLPNILFIMDTSGSMDWTVASLGGSGNYDPDVDYGSDGDAEDDDYVYIYDTDFSYEGVYVTPEQNACQTMKDFHVNLANFPLYNDVALQWQSKEVTVEGTDCDVGGGGQDSVSGSGKVNKKGTQTYPGTNFSSGISDFVPGSQITMEVDAEDNGTHAFSLIYNTGGYYWYYMPGCVQVYVGPWDQSDCTTTIPDDATEILGYFDGNKNSKQNNIDFEYEITYYTSSGSGSTTCPDETVIGTQWTQDFEQSSDSGWVLECQDDRGVDGLTSGSSEKYVEYCSAGTGCDAAEYTSSSSSEVNWNSLDNHYYIPGNLHDYITQRGIEDISGLSFEDVDTYCSGNTSKNEGDVFVDSQTGLIYTCERKIEIMQAAATDLVNGLSGVNVALMRFNQSNSSKVDFYASNGGSLLTEMEDVTSARSDFIDAVDDLPAYGGTPLSETLYEAYLYFAGKQQKWGLSSTSVDSGSYESPIEHSCQSNNIVYLTDGEPSSTDTSADSLIEALNGSCSGNCMDELAEYMADNDMAPSLEGVNSVNTYTIGFDIDFDLLSDTAEKGNGEYFIASDYIQLQTAFQSIIVSILSESSTFVAPAVSVNAFNELQHNDQIYYAVFKPSASARWSGNVKKYRIDGDGTVTDQTGENAIDDSGFFSDSAWSFWSDSPDGSSVDAGGYREQLTNSRRIFTDASAVVGATGTGVVELTSTSELNVTGLLEDILDGVFGTINGVTGGLFSSGEDLDADDALSWLLGVDVFNDDNDTSIYDAHQFGADPLHSKPFVVTFSGSSDGDSRDVLFFTDNMGMLSAIDARDGYGTELWSYIPADLISNISGYAQEVAGDEKLYGLDGEAEVISVESESSTRDNFALSNVYMFQGMRRGGNNYYAFDLSNALSTTGTPMSVMWKIVGGSGDYADLGQTWSKPIASTIGYDCNSSGTACSERQVLIFSGGYDTYYDDRTASMVTANNQAKQGNALYMVDALTGQLLWSAGNKSASSVDYDLDLSIVNSMPATPSPVDVDGDGLIDMVFAVDISGDLWRVDFDQTQSLGDDYATGGKIAELGDSDTRYFYNRPDVSLHTPRGEASFFAISIGSGYRAHPKDEASHSDNIYVVFDENVNGPLTIEDDVYYEYVGSTESNRDVIQLSDLYAYSSSNPAVKGENANYGFYRSLDEGGEKILQSSVTVDGKVVVSSFVPDAGSVSATCGSGQVGGGRVYLFDILTGESLLGDDGDEEYLELSHGGIPPDVSVLLVPEFVVCVGTECFGEDDELAQKLAPETGVATKTYWRVEQ